MKMTALQESWQEHLIEQIEARLGHPLSLPVRTAFRRVSRVHFVTHYYDDARQLCLAPAEEGPQWVQWVEHILRDEALTTRLDARGLPRSSSSQPSLMAALLEALQVQPGQRVLEIGTGTGYNAALLAESVGPQGQVWSVEIDAEQATQARERLQRAGYGGRVQVLVTDGREGCAAAAPYDRVIATASALPLPGAWLEQVAPTGRLVGDLRGGLGGGLLCLTASARVADGYEGSFLPGWEQVSFMRLRAPQEATVSWSVPAEASTWPLQDDQQILPEEPAAELARQLVYHERWLHATALRCWFQWTFPTLRMKWQQVPSANNTRCAVIVEPQGPTVLWVRRAGAGFQVEGRGRQRLWEALVQAYDAWERAGQPGLASTQLVARRCGAQQIEVLDRAGHCWRFPLPAAAPGAGDGTERRQPMH